MGASLIKQRMTAAYADVRSGPTRLRTRWIRDVLVDYLSLAVALRALQERLAQGDDAFRVEPGRLEACEADADLDGVAAFGKLRLDPLHDRQGLRPGYARHQHPDLIGAGTRDRVEPSIMTPRRLDNSGQRGIACPAAVAMACLPGVVADHEGNCKCLARPGMACELHPENLGEVSAVRCRRHYVGAHPRRRLFEHYA